MQRTLFRMQCDDDFAARVFARESSALATIELKPTELELLCSLSPAGVRADPGGTRKGQVLGNIATEFVLTIAEASAAGQRDLLDAFLGSAEFHAAMIEDTRMPLAFGAYATRRASGVASSALTGLVELECAMVRARRAETSAPKLAAGEVLLAPGSKLVRIAAGQADYADALRANLEAGAPLPSFRALQGSELILVAPRPAANIFALGEVHVERLDSPVDQLLESARQPLGIDARAALAERFDASPADLERFVRDLIDDGLLIAG